MFVSASTNIVIRNFVLFVFYSVRFFSTNIVIHNFVLFFFCSVCFCSTNIALQFFVLFGITKMPIQIFFYCNFTLKYLFMYSNFFFFPFHYCNFLCSFRIC